LGIGRQNLTDLDTLGILHAQEDPEIQQLLVRAFKDTGFFCKLFFPDIFSAPFAPAHLDIFKVLDDPTRSKLTVQAPRGIGKSAIARAYTAKVIYFQMAYFVVYLSSTASFAETQTENIKNMMINSEFGSSVFGKPKDSLSADIPEMLAKTAWMFNNGVFVLPRGAGQQIRGLNIQVLKGNYRPEMIIVDDLENIINVKNPEQRADLKNWFAGDVEYTRSYTSKRFRIFYIDTLKHADSQLVHLQESPDWYSIKIPMADENLKSLFPDFVPDDEIQREYDKHDQMGTLDVFFREWLGKPISTKDASFTKALFKYYNEEDEDFKKSLSEGNLISLAILDPARSVKLQSASSGFVIWSVDIKNRKFYFRYGQGLKMYPNDLYDFVFDMAIRYDCRVLAYETTGLEEHIIYPMEKWAKEKHFGGQLKQLRARKGSGEYQKEDGKLARIGSLVPYYRQGHIVHNITQCRPYEAQLLSFPNSKYKDIMDAAAYLPQILKEGELFPVGYTEDMYDYKSEEQRYKSLLKNYDAPIQGWRSC
jgi:hypothetical protein